MIKEGLTFSRNILWALKVSYKVSKKFFIVKVLIIVMGLITPLVSMWSWKELLNQLTYRENNVAGYQILLVYLINYILIKIMIYIEKFSNVIYEDKIIFFIEKEMIKKTSKVDLEFFDSASMMDKVVHVRNNFDVLKDIIQVLFNLLSAFLNICLTFYIISSYRWYIGIITVLLMVPYFYCNKFFSTKKLELEQELIVENRKKEYCCEILLDPIAQMEIQLHKSGLFFIDLYKEFWGKVFEKNIQLEIKVSLINLILSMINIFSEIWVLIISIQDILITRIGIGDLQYNLNIISRLQEQAIYMVEELNKFSIYNIRLIQIKEFIEMKPVIEDSGVLIPNRNFEIEFCDVYFRYPNMDDYILKGCSFKVSSNEKVGLIGINGSGKSTIIKLLLRFYNPQKGSIKIDKIDIREYDIYEIRKIFTVLFQDYVTYSLPLREIIALSDLEKVYDDEKLTEACNTSGALRVIKNWEEGFDSIVGRYYMDNGKNLSGGEWQLIALARAYLRQAPAMILDEPSAALDPISEDKIFKQLYELGNNKTLITISHRLSNTMLADKLIILEDGRVIEEGSHQELLWKEGQYYCWFNLQASRYK